MIPLLFAVQCLFSPPPGWEIADPKTPSNRAIVGFVDKSKSGFCPSLNLTYEKVTISTEDYLKIVKKNALAKKQQWKHLGRIETRSGPAEIIEIDTKNNLGQIRLLQALLRKGEDLYILTAGTLKKDFGKYAAAIEKSVHSMLLAEDLAELIPVEEERKALTSLKKDDRSAFEKKVLDYKELGPVWQILLLKEE